VADLSRLVVYIRVSAPEAAVLQVGQPARLVGGGIEHAGRVQRVSLQADPATRLVEVEVAFPPAPGLIAGTLASIQIRVATRDDAVQVPRAAVRAGRAWVVDGDGRAEPRTVRVGLEAVDVAEVLSGIEPGERVVVQGGALLSEGAMVRVVNEADDV
jgi:RND family efflux transporter MFP subunit